MKNILHNTCLIFVFIFILYMYSPAYGEQQDKRQKPSPVKTDTPTDSQDTIKMGDVFLVSVTVSATDERNRTFPDLTSDNFELYCDSVKQQIAFFDTGSKPASIGIIYDISGSMDAQKSQYSRLALQNLFREESFGDQYFMVIFDSAARLACDYTHDSNKVINALPLNPPRQSTAFYDGIMLGIKTLAPNKDEYNSMPQHQRDAVDAAKQQRKILIIISDGQDNHSRYNEGEIRERLKEKDLTLYTITISDMQNYDSTSRQGEEIMRDLAKKTGGENFIPESSRQMAENCSTIRRLIGHQYVLGFYYDGKRDGEFKKIKIKPIPPRGSPKIVLRYREGFRAPKDPRPDTKDPTSKTTSFNIPLTKRDIYFIIIMCYTYSIVY